MVLNKQSKVEYYTFQSFENTGCVRHCFSTRKGGISNGCCESMNLAFRKQDLKENVARNFELLCTAAGFTYEGLTFSRQVHETNIMRIRAEHRGNGFFYDNQFDSVDGIMTDEQGIVLTTFYADCVPLFMIDPVRRAIALSHAGWRGTAAEMGRKTVEAMAGEFGSRPGDLLAGIGPSIGPCCFEVDRPVKEEFIEKLPFSAAYIKAAGEKFYIDLWAVNRQQLMAAGVPERNIEVAGICTKCNPDRFFSHRLMGAERGSMAAFMELVEG